MEYLGSPEFANARAGRPGQAGRRRHLRVPHREQERRSEPSGHRSSRASSSRSRPPTRRRSTPPTRCPPKSARARSGPRARRSSTATRTPRRPPTTSRPPGRADRLSARPARADGSWCRWLRSEATGTVVVRLMSAATDRNGGVQHGRRRGHRRRDRSARPASRPRPERMREEPRRAGLHVSSVLRLLVFGALAAFLLYYVGPRDMAETALKVALAVALTVGALGRRQPPLRPGVRPLDPVQHHHRCHARLPRLLRRRGQRLLRTLVDKPVRPFGQGLFDDHHRLEDAAARRQRPAVGTDRRCGARVGDVPAQRAAAAARPAPAGGGRVHAFGLLTAFALDDSVWPALDWGKLLVCVASRRRRVRPDRPVALRARPPPRSRSSRASPSAGSSAPGAAPTSAPATSARSSLATVVPAAILGVRFGLADRARRPEATAHRSALPLLDLRHPGAGVHRHRVARPADPHDLSLVPQPQRHQVRRLGQLHDDLHTARTRSNFDNWENIFTSQLFCIALALVGARRARRRVRRAADEPALRARSQLGRPDPGRSLRPVVRGPRRRSGARSSTTSGGSSSSRRWRRCSVWPSPCSPTGRSRERGQVVDLPPDGDLVHRRRDHLALHVPGPRSRRRTRPA